MPFVLLGLLEITLRIGGFAKPIPLFVESPISKEFLQPNPDIISRYFPSKDAAPNVSPDTVLFKKEKHDDTFRIFIQGGSTAAGFPYGRWGSLQGMLEQRFKREYPNQHIEIINTAMSAVNSYTLLDFVDEIIDQAPDLVVIYAGHNEYLGVMGVGSAYAAKGGRTATLSYLTLKNLRLYRLIETFVYSLMKNAKSQNSAESDDTNASSAQDQRTLMSKVAKEKNIPLNGPLYRQGISQFSGNISDILERYKQARIPVLIGTLASNEKDQAPFSSIQTVQWDDFKTGLKNSALDKNLDTIKTQITSENSAEAHYKAALIYEQLSQKKRARTFFTQARDRDTLRFRAPGEFNDIITAEAERHGAILVDTEAALIADNGGQAIGFEHMLEHLHPNKRGYFILAEAFAKKIASEKLLPTPPLPLSQKKAWKDIPITRSDSLYGEYKVAKLTSDYPFKREKIHVALPKPSTLENIAVVKRTQGQHWLDIQKILLVEYQKSKDFGEAAKIASLISDALPHEAQVASISGRLYMRTQDIELATYYFRRAHDLAPQNDTYQIDLAHVEYLNQQTDISLGHLNAVVKRSPGNERAQFFIKKIMTETKQK